MVCLGILGLWKKRVSRLLGHVDFTGASSGVRGSVVQAQ